MDVLTAPVTGQVEEARIRAVWEKLARAWSASDLRGVVAAWDVDSDHRRIGTMDSPGCGGRDQLARCLEAAFSRRPGSAKRSLSCRIGSIRFLTTEVAVVDGLLEVTAPGTTTPALAEPMTAVMTKRGDSWLIAASRVAAPRPITARA